MSLQVRRRSEDLRVSNPAGLAYEHDARANAQRRSDVKAMREPACVSPTDGRSLYIVQEMGDRTDVKGVLVSTYS